MHLMLLHLFGIWFDIIINNKYFVFVGWCFASSAYIAE